jgi:c-di-GMP-binding flagellar brake protein YcgR
MEANERPAGPANERRYQPQGLPQDRRTHPRYNVDEDSILLLVSHGLSLESHVLDLSLEGCRLRMRERCTAGARTRVEVSFKVNGIAFRFLGVIQWADGKSQVGVRFVEVASRRKEQLGEVICEMEGAAARAAEEAAAESDAKEQEAIAEAGERARQLGQNLAEELAGSEERELAEREAREWAEIQEMARRLKDGREAAVFQQPVKRDRRSQVRHEVDTTATILLINIGSTLKGHIVDLSMNGCQIRSDERFPVGIYTRVETEFRLEGLPFRLGGVIQAIHGPHNVGIRFLDMSQRKREQVEQLIQEIEGQRSRSAAAKEGADGGQG